MLTETKDKAVQLQQISMSKDTHAVKYYLNLLINPSNFHRCTDMSIHTHTDCNVFLFNTLQSAQFFISDKWCWWKQSTTEWLPLLVFVLLGPLGMKWWKFIALGFLGCQQLACQFKGEISPIQCHQLSFTTSIKNRSLKTLYIQHWITTAPIFFQPTSYKQALLQAPPPHCILQPFNMCSSIPSLLNEALKALYTLQRSAYGTKSIKFTESIMLFHD